MSDKKVLMVLASKSFRDPEFFEPKRVLEAAGVKVLTSSSAPMSTGAEGGRVKIDVLLDKVDPNNYDAVAFIGGPGASEYFDNPTAHGIAKKTLSSGKLLCAICIAPVILANAGVL
jgi:protease I